MVFECNYYQNSIQVLTNVSLVCWLWLGLGGVWVGFVWGGMGFGGCGVCGGLGLGLIFFVWVWSGLGLGFIFFCLGFEWVGLGLGFFGVFFSFYFWCFSGFSFN